MTPITRTPSRAVGAKIRELREQRRFSQRLLAERSAVHPSNLGKLERGEANPNIDTLTRIAVALECTVSELTEYITTPLTYRGVSYDAPPSPANPRRALGRYSAIGHSSSLPSR